MTELPTDGVYEAADHRRGRWDGRKRTRSRSQAPRGSPALTRAVPDPPADQSICSSRTVLELHAAIIGGTIAQAADQLRNRSGLEGAVATPASYAHYEGADLSLQAVVLTHGLADGQWFIDGNNRVA